MKKWNEKNKLEKTMDIISAVALCVWFILERLSSANKLPNAELACCIALCVICVCEAVSFWNTKRVLSYVAIGGIVLMLSALILLAL